MIIRHQLYNYIANHLILCNGGNLQHHATVRCFNWCPRSGLSGSVPPCSSPGSRPLRTLCLLMVTSPSPVWWSDTCPLSIFWVGLRWSTTGGGVPGPSRFWWSDICSVFIFWAGLHWSLSHTGVPGPLLFRWSDLLPPWLYSVIGVVPECLLFSSTSPLLLGPTLVAVYSEIELPVYQDLLLPRNHYFHVAWGYLAKFP